MIGQQNSLEDYKKAIRLKYEVEKIDFYSSFLIKPSRAKLRKLCIERMKKNKNQDDFSSFTIFFGFDFDIGNLNKLKLQTDKFRPIETFLMGKTDLSDIEGINIAAFLVDFNPRPFKRYCQNKAANEIVDENFQENEYEEVDTIPKNIGVVTKNEGIITDNSAKKKIMTVAVVLISLFLTGYTAKNIFFPTKQCMQWQGNHYEEVDCSNNQLGIGQLNLIVPVDEQTMELKKLDSKAEQVFFINDKPVVWYSKENGKIELFNQPGFHPESGKPLRPITNYIIEKYQLRSKE